MFTLQGGNWNETARLSPSDGAGQDEFGNRTALDGDRVAVSAWGKNMRQGAVYVYDYAAGAWSETARLYGQTIRPPEILGTALALQGDKLIVGAINAPLPTAAVRAGAAYLYERSGGAWIQRRVLVSSNAADLDRFGTSAIWLGTTAVVGSARGGPRSTGMAYAYSPALDLASPVVTRVTARPTNPRRNQPFEISAFADDRTTGGSAIRAATYRIDTGPESPASSFDGLFDEPSEAILFVVPGIATLGRHDVCIRARDASDNISAPSCVRVRVR